MFAALVGRCLVIFVVSYTITVVVVVALAILSYKPDAPRVLIRDSDEQATGTLVEPTIEQPQVEPPAIEPQPKRRVIQQ
jgi:hypothetical protein